jgi:DTW domain-containing protein YfiP
MLSPLCICTDTPHLNLKTRVLIFMHAREYPLITNTGTLAHRMLDNSAICFRGARTKKQMSWEEILPPEYEPFVLFPHSNASPLTPEFLAERKKPMMLICPDGHWGQASKLIRHEPSLQDLPRVQLPEGALSNYRLRRNIVPNRVCTFEAISAALGIIEGDAIQERMMTVFEKMVTRILWSRGRAESYV